MIQFLPRLCRELVIPAGVVAEVHTGRIADAARVWLQAEGKGFVHPVRAIHAALANWRGGHGEAEVISWALQNPGFTAVLDDRHARTLAGKNGVPVIGSLRVVVLAKQSGLIPSAKASLNKLRGAGAWVTDELIDRAIALSGES